MIKISDNIQKQRIKRTSNKDIFQTKNGNASFIVHVL